MISRIQQEGDISVSDFQVSKAAQCCDPDHSFDPALLCCSDGCVRKVQPFPQSPKTHFSGDHGNCTVTGQCCTAVSSPSWSHGPCANPLFGSGSVGPPTAVQSEEAAGFGGEFRNHTGESQASSEYWTVLYRSDQGGVVILQKYIIDDFTCRELKKILRYFESCM